MNDNPTTSVQQAASRLSKQYTTTENRYPKFFGISILRLIVMDIATLGLYTIYWFYRNFSVLKRPEQSNLALFLKAVLHNFFAYPLFTSMASSIKAPEKKRHFLRQAKVCGGIYVSASMASILLGLMQVQTPVYVVAGMYVGKMIILCIIQRMVLWHRGKMTPNYKPVQQFTLAEVILLIVGMLIFSLLLLGMMNMEYITQMGAGNPA